MKEVQKRIRALARESGLTDKASVSDSHGWRTAERAHEAKGRANVDYGCNRRVAILGEAGRVTRCSTDGLMGFREAITAVFSRTIVQTCIVYLVRHSLEFAS